MNKFVLFLRWADQCPRRPHDVNRRTDKFAFVGQNYAWRSSSKDEQEHDILPMMVEAWYNEVRIARKYREASPKMNSMIQAFSMSDCYSFFRSRI